MNIWDFVILLLIGAAVFLAVRYLHGHKNGCASGCAGCPCQNCTARKLREQDHA